MAANGRTGTPDEPAISTTMAAALLNISPKTLREWRRRGEGPPFYKLTAQMVVYTRTEVLEWRDARRVTPIA